jgi:hypothetical protein
VTALELFLEIYEDRSNLACTGLSTGTPKESIILDEIKRLILFHLATVMPNRAADEFVQSDEKLRGFSNLIIDIARRVDLLDFLYGEVYECFVEAKKIGCFLESLETYILLDKLPYISPLVANAFVDHYHHAMMLTSLEECILHINPGILDVDRVINLCRKHKLNNALIYIFNIGLNDYISPIAEILLFQNTSTSPGSTDAKIIQADENIGSPAIYQLFLYLSCIFHGQSFPQGSLSPEKALKAKQTCYNFIFSPIPVTLAYFQNIKDQTTTRSFPYLRLLLEAGFDDTLAILSYAFDDDDVDKRVFIRQADWSSIQTTFSKEQSRYYIDSTRRFLAEVMMDVVSNNTPSFSQVNIINFYIFLSKYLVRFQRFISFGEQTYYKMILRLCSNDDVTSKKAREIAVGHLLEIYNPSSSQENEFVQLFEECGFLKLCQVAYMKQEDYCKMITCYIQDSEDGVEVFKSIRCLMFSLVLSEKSKNALIEAILTNVKDLLILNGSEAVRLILDHLLDKVEAINSMLYDHPLLQFKFYKYVLQSTHELDRLPNAGVGVVIDKKRYLELLCLYEPSQCLPFIIDNFKDIPVGDQIQVCKQHGRVDALSWILDKSGDVQGALQVYVEAIEERLEDAFRIMSAKDEDNTKKAEDSLAVLRSRLVTGLGLYKSAIKLLQKHNDPTVHELWFSLVDILFRCHRQLKQETDIDPLVADSLLQYTQALISGIVGYMSLPLLLSKILERNATCKFEQVREIFQHILEAYHYEQSLVESTNHLLLEDVWGLVCSHIKRRKKGIHVSSPRCSSCGKMLNAVFEHPTSITLDEDMVVLPCGHSFHQPCHTTSNLCPVCFPQEQE